MKFDKNNTIERLGLDEDIVDMLLDNFFLTLDSDLQKLQNAYDSKINEDISKAAHYIKGACTNLGMDEATEILQNIVNQPFAITNTLGTYSVKATVDGGGPTGQAEAMRLAISRVLCELNPEFRPPLKKEGLLRRDPRMVERKKPGRKKARKRFQFSKR